MAHWLMKTEPDDYSWDRLVADGETEWSGVRNHQAAANMRAMKLGERAFFYRSVVEPAIVGVMTVSADGLPGSGRPERQVRARQGQAAAASGARGILKAIKADPALRRLRAGPPVAAVGGAGRRRALARLVRHGRNRALKRKRPAAGGGRPLATLGP